MYSFIHDLTNFTVTSHPFLKQKLIPLHRMNMPTETDLEAAIFSHAVDHDNGDPDERE